MLKSFLKGFEKSMDKREEALVKGVRSEAKYILRRVIGNIKGFKNQHKENETDIINKVNIKQDIRIKSMQAAIKVLKDYARSYPDKSEFVYSIILDYKAMINRTKHPKKNHDEKMEKQKEGLRIKVMDVERSAVNQMYESGEVNMEQARELRRYINYIETVILYRTAE